MTGVNDGAARAPHQTFLGHNVGSGHWLAIPCLQTGELYFERSYALRGAPIENTGGEKRDARSEQDYGVVSQNVTNIRSIVIPTERYRLRKNDGTSRSDGARDNQWSNFFHRMWGGVSHASFMANVAVIRANDGAACGLQEECLTQASDPVIGYAGYFFSSITGSPTVPSIKTTTSNGTSELDFGPAGLNWMM
jgi:hypothetical protein